MNFHPRRCRRTAYVDRTLGECVPRYVPLQSIDRMYHHHGTSPTSLVCTTDDGKKLSLDHEWLFGF